MRSRRGLGRSQDSRRFRVASVFTSYTDGARMKNGRMTRRRAMANGPEPVPARRASDRGRYGRLNRERVLTAALVLVDREGLSALSMRRLGAELGVEAMALYRYAASKDALLDGLVEALYLELEERLT